MEMTLTGLVYAGEAHTGRMGTKLLILVTQSKKNASDGWNKKELDHVTAAESC